MTPTDRLFLFLRDADRYRARLEVLHERGEENGPEGHELYARFKSQHCVEPFHGSVRLLSDHVLDETIVDERQEGPLFRIVTRYPTVYGDYHYVYFFARTESSEWRVASIVHCWSHHPDARLFADRRADFEDRCARVSERTPERVAPSARRVEALFDPSQAEVMHVGEIEVTSGLLCISDMATSHVPRILGRRVAAGRYVVEAASVHALRLRFSKGGHVRSWREAELIGEAGRVHDGFPVDDALALVGDAVAHAALTNAEAFSFEARTEGEEHVLYGPAGAAWPTGVISASGLGDGYYPVYLGLDEVENPVAIVLDFLSRETPFD